MEPVDRSCVHIKRPSWFGNALPLIQQAADQSAPIGGQFRRPPEVDFPLQWGIATDRRAACRSFSPSRRSRVYCR